VIKLVAGCSIVKTRYLFDFQRIYGYQPDMA